VDEAIAGGFGRTLSACSGLEIAKHDVAESTFICGTRVKLQSEQTAGRTSLTVIVDANAHAAAVDYLFVTAVYGLYGFVPQHHWGRDRRPRFSEKRCQPAQGWRLRSMILRNSTFIGGPT
jgi:hypothetical protein